MTHADISAMIKALVVAPDPQTRDALAETLLAMLGEITALQRDVAGLKLRGRPFKAFSGIRNRKGVLRR